MFDSVLETVNHLNVCSIKSVFRLEKIERVILSGTVKSVFKERYNGNLHMIGDSRAKIGKWKFYPVMNFIFNDESDAVEIGVIRDFTPCLPRVFKSCINTNSEARMKINAGKESKADITELCCEFNLQCFRQGKVIDFSKIAVTGKRRERNCVDWCKYRRLWKRN